MGASPTFGCPFCGAPISGAAAGTTFACPYCQAKVVAPGMQQQAYVPSQRTPSMAPAAHAGGPFSEGVGGVALGFDPQLGFIAVGGHAPHGEPPRLRAWDLVQGRVLWEAQQGQPWTGELGREGIKVIGRNVYVAHKRQLMAFDLASGNRKWGSPLSDAIDGDSAPQGGLSVFDPFPAQGRGAILVRTIDNGLFAFDRDSGQALWNRSYGDKSFELQAVEGHGACLVRYGFPYIKIDVVNPAYPQPIASLGHDDWSTDLGLAKVQGRTVVTSVDDYGPDGDVDGLLAFDAVTGAPHFFEPAPDLDKDEIVPCSMGQRVFAAMDEGAGIYVGPRGRTIGCPVPNHAVVAFCAAGPTLVLLLKKAQGTPVRRIVGIDPATLAFRFDAGEAGSEPEDDWDRQVASDGWSLVFVASPEDDRHRCELRSVDTTTGRTLWSRSVGYWQAHAFVGGHLVAWSEDRIEVLAPANGQVVAKLE